MNDFIIGDYVERIGGDRPAQFEAGGQFCEGERGTISAISRDGKNISVDTDEGWTSTGNAPHKLRLITRQNQPNQTKKPTMLKKINNYMKTLLDSDTQKLVKAGFINGDLLPTQEGEEALMHILFSTNKDALVKLADEKIAEEDK